MGSSRDGMKISFKFNESTAKLAVLVWILYDFFCPMKRSMVAHVTYLIGYDLFTFILEYSNGAQFLSLYIYIYINKESYNDKKYLI